MPASEPPFAIGARIRRGKAGNRYRVVRCEAKETGGWYVFLRGPYGIFRTTLDNIERAGYIVIRRQRRKKG